uniref:BHLH domain-containing protein n=1 Tax=Araucaria cunninghamii TaxID=56994 RepID=A0A0D6QUX2_ARACU
MNSSAVMFPAFVPCRNVQSNERDFWPFPFQQDFTSVEADMMISNTRDALHFSQGIPSAKRKDGSTPGKKCLRSEVERKRRMSMKSRYSELRSSLPEGKIKGKVSISDQLSEAASYIRHLQENIDQLAKKRDEMKINGRHCSKDEVYNTMACHTSETFPLVSVNCVASHVIVTINTFRDQIIFSRLLLAIEDEGFQVLTAASFATKQKVFYTVHCKVLDMQGFRNGAQLRHKLCQLIN